MNASNWIAICGFSRTKQGRHLRSVAGVAVGLPLQGHCGRSWPRRLMVYGALLLSLAVQPALSDAQEPLTLNSDVPLTYTVKPGDTLWDISTLFLRDPWRWQELWAGNPQVDNPHLIYPGDELRLIWEDGIPRLVRAQQSVVKLSPTMRPSPLDLAIPPISRQHIDPFLRQHRVAEVKALESAPYIVSGDDGRLISGVGDTVYGTGAWHEDRSFRLVRRLGKLTDPVSGEGLGIFVSDIGEAMLHDGEATAGLAAMTVTEMREEIRIGDRMLPVTEAALDTVFQPQAPSTSVDNAFMIAVAGGVTQIGVLDIVVINKGERDALRVGDVLAIDQAGQEVKDPISAKMVRLPDTRAGVLMVIAVYDRASFGLVLEATRALRVGDKLVNP